MNLLEGEPIANACESESFELLNPMAVEGWDDLVRSHPGYSVFHGKAWARVLQQAYGFDPQYVVLRQGPELRAALPIMEAGGWLKGLRGISLPFTDSCAPLLSEGVDVSELIDFTLTHGRERKWKYWEARELAGERPASVSFYQHSIDLRPGTAKAVDRFDSSVKRAIRKAEKSDVEVEIGVAPDFIDHFFNLHSKTRRVHGLPPQPKSFFSSIQEQLLQRGQGFVALAHHGGRPIAGAVYLSLGKRAVYKFGASDPSFRHTRANNLVMSESIKELCRQGMESLHLGRTSRDNDGLRRFKMGWGAEEESLCYHRYDFHEEAFVESRDEASGWYNPLFRLMPGPLSRLTGAVLYRHIA